MDNPMVSMELKSPVRPPRWYRGRVEGPRLSLIIIRKLRCGAAAVGSVAADDQILGGEGYEDEDRGVKVFSGAVVV